MPFTTNLNVSPYYDDFDENKNYYHILFRPATAVQARELTQLQTILQNQIERFGNWAFKNGDIVQGCSVNDLPVVPYVFLSDSLANTASYDAREYVNCIAKSTTSNLQARILFANVGFQGNYPNCNIIYLNYINTGNTGAQQYSNNELLSVYRIDANTGANTLIANVYTLANVAGTNTTGNAHGISVSEGIIFINGAFVKVTQPTFGLVNNFGTYASNNVVGFQTLEEIIDENEDSSLLDNALGYSNENAPGAHRLKVTPILTSLDETVSANTKGFNPIAVYNYGTIVSKSSDAGVYSIVEKALATRTYEESGNYVVNPFLIDTITDSGDPSVAPLDANHLFVKVNPGVGYAEGSRVVIDKAAYVNIRRGVDTKTDESQQISFNFGNYFQINEFAGSFNFDKAQTITLYDAPQQAVSTRKYSTLNPIGNAIGTAKARCITYSSGVVGTATAQYYLHVFDIKMGNGYNVNQIRSVYYSSGTTKGVADLNALGVINSSQKSQLYTFGSTGLKNLRDTSNNINTNYTYRAKTASSLTTNGSVTITLSTSLQGGIDILPYGTGTISEFQAKSISLTPTSNVASAALTGTVNTYSTNTAVRGSSTLFTTHFIPGDLIYVGTDIRTVVSVTNTTFLTVDAPFSSTTSAQPYYKYFQAGKQIPVGVNLVDTNGVSLGSYSYANVGNTTSFTIYLNVPPAASVGADVTYDVYRTVAVPAKKAIKKNRFVKIDTSSNPQGPWCLGVSDLHNVSAVYGSTNASSQYSISNQNITNLFVFNTGQKDSHYDLAYLSLKPGMSTVTGTANYLLVQMDYFTQNTTPGVGFYTIESYPIDDANAANTIGIQSKDVPLYINEKGEKISLRDYVDFRPVAQHTATDTGYANTSNASQVSAALALASINPSNTVTIPSTYSLNVPSYGRNFEADVTYYLPRRDILFITSDNKLKVKEGVASPTPKTPLYPSSAMVLAELYVPAYPSLTADQVTSLASVNRMCQNVCRDVTSRCGATSVTNRRYTMKDIGLLENRINNLEYYTQLSLLEKAAKDMTVTDANGLDRFKNGFFVEPFNDFRLSDVSNPEFNMAIDTQNGLARPRFIREVINLKFNGGLTTVNNSGTGNRDFFVDQTNNVQKTGRCITLPYQETSFLKQPYATKYRAASHVAFAWNGRLTLYPSLKTSKFTSWLDPVNITMDGAKPWQDFANGPFQYTWGDWRTTVDTQVTTAITGEVRTYNYAINYGWQSSHDLPAPNLTKDELYNILIFNGIDPGSDFVIGDIINWYSGSAPDNMTVLSLPTTPAAAGGGDNGFAAAWVIGWAFGWW